MADTDKQSEEQFDVSLIQMLVLAANVVKAKTLPEEVGYLDWDVPFWRFLAKLNKYRTHIKKSELEAALWACNLLDEQGEFFNLDGEKLDVFINKIMNYKQRRLHFDSVYNHITARPKMGRPKDVGFNKIKPKKVEK